MESNNSKPEAMYCGQGVDDFHTKYVLIHGYLSLLVCIFGSIANSLNIIVLTRREMRSPTNAILTGLAIADLLVMIDYIPFSFLGYILPQLNISREILFTYSAAWFVYFHAIFAQICHTISIWLTVTLAIWRYIAVAHPQKNRLWCVMKTTLIAIASSYVICPLIAIPLYLSFSITPWIVTLDQNGNPTRVNTTSVSQNNILMSHEKNQSDIATMMTMTMSRNVTLYKVNPSPLANNSSIMLNANLWIYTVAIKFIPCVALTILSLRLIGALLEAKRRRKQLTSNNATGMKTIVNGKVVEKVQKNSKTLEKEKQTDRTTRMLLAVLLLFLTTEFPQGILGLLSAVLEKSFFMECYQKLGDFMDILALINSAINFILYCSMSRQFRSTFTLLFRPKCLDKWLPVAQDDDANGGGGGAGCADGRTNCGGKDNFNGQTTQVTQV